MAQPNKRYANLVAEIDEISEICEREGHTEVCALLDEVGAELAEAPAATPKAAKAPKQTTASKELRDVAKQLSQSGNIREARNVLRVADEMDLGLEAEEPMPPVEEEPGAEVPEAGGCTPCPTCGANPPQPEMAPEESLEEPGVDDGMESLKAPSDETVQAAMRVLERKLAAFKGAEDTNEMAEKAISDAESEAKKNLRKDPEAKSAKNLLAEIEALEASLGAPRRSTKPTVASKPVASDKAAKTVRDIAKKLEADGKSRLAKRVRSLLG